VLLVEDHPINRKLAHNILTSRGYRVLEAVSGEQALERAGNELPDLILMDIQLPKLDGLEVTRRLKANPATAGIPVVALTAYAQKEDEDKAREAGCIGYITKPIRLNLFPSQIEAFLKAEEGAA
jgi:two-component system cell cycle response regulator DivK